MCAKVQVGAREGSGTDAILDSVGVLRVSRCAAEEKRGENKRVCASRGHVYKEEPERERERERETNLGREPRSIARHFDG
jgi:hypothetical protein